LRFVQSKLAARGVLLAKALRSGNG
jgi:hypothetical protein